MLDTFLFLNLAEESFSMNCKEYPCNSPSTSVSTWPVIFTYTEGQVQVIENNRYTINSMVEVQSKRPWRSSEYLSSIADDFTWKPRKCEMSPEIHK